MFNQELKLLPRLLDDFGATPAMANTRDGFGKALMELGEKNKNVVALCADLAESTRMLAFKEKYPDRYVELGVAEQNLATIASGLANYGKIPFIASYATFSPGRNNEQIRTTITLNDVPVKIIGSHAGVSVGPDGATHQALEDIALMRVQPNVVVLSPCDIEEARKATLSAAENGSPTYIRLAREKTPVMTTAETPFEIGKANVVWTTQDSTLNHDSQGRTLKTEVAIFATGPLLFNALRAAKKLENEIGITVINLHTIKPLDEEIILRCAKDAGAVVTVEEHQIAGGMGSAVAELLAQKCPTPIEFVGVRDRFGQSGTPEELIEHYGMGVQNIINAVKNVIKRKG